MSATKQTRVQAMVGMLLFVALLVRALHGAQCGGGSGTDVGSRALFAICQDGRCGFIDHDGQIVIQPQFEEVGHLVFGLAQYEGWAQIKEIELERRGCLGQCPDYTIDLRSDGSAMYSGRFFVARVGTYSGQVARRDFDRLAKLIQSAGFFDLNEWYPIGIDLPSVVIKVVKGRSSKEVEYGETGSPTQLWGIEMAIEAIAARIGWSATRRSRPGSQIAPGFPVCPGIGQNKMQGCVSQTGAGGAHERRRLRRASRDAGGRDRSKVTRRKIREAQLVTDFVNTFPLLGHVHPQQFPSERSWLSPLYARLPGRFPPLFEQLVLSYRWEEEVELGYFRLLANPGNSNFAGLADEMFRDKGLVECVVPGGFIQFGKRSGANYDPVCFDLRSRRKGGDCRVVQLDHEQILCHHRLREVAELAPSFRELMSRVIADATHRRRA